MKKSTGGYTIKEVDNTFTGYDFQNYDSEAVNIWFGGKLSSHCIFWSHVSTGEKENGHINSSVRNERTIFSVIEFIVAYCVPAIVEVFTVVWSTMTSFANPKSAILGFISLSSKILLDLRSRCIMVSKESMWRYRIPHAIPSMILYLVLQSR